MTQETPEEFYPENYSETREFQLNYQNTIYNILIGSTPNKIIMRTIHFSLEKSLNDFCQLTSKKFNSINEIFNFIDNNFANNQVKISGVSNSEMNLLFTAQKFGLTLEFHAQNTDHIINNLWNKILTLELKLNYLTEENKQLKEENNNLKNQINGNNLNNKNNFNNNINNFNNNMNNINNMNNFNNNMNNMNNINDINNFNNNMNNMIVERMINNINNININNNNFKNDFNNNSNNNLNQIEEHGFSIIVERSGQKNMVSLENCFSNDKISDLMTRYRNKINDYSSQFYFTYNAKQLNPNKTLSEEGLISLAKIIVMKGKPPLNYQS